MDYINQFTVIENYLLKEMKKNAISISPEDEEYINRQNNEISNSMMECIYIIDKYTKTKIIPYNYEVILSKEIKESELYKKNLKRINKFKKYLKEGNININSPSENYIPSSYKRYFQQNKKQGKEIAPDIINDFYGIRHAYLVNRKVDELLFYTISNGKAYLLNIGVHEDIFKPKNLEILVNEFPHLENELGFAGLDGIDPDDHSTPQEVEHAWKSGITLGFIVNDKRYFGHPMTFSRFNSDYISIIQNIYYQIEQGLISLGKKLNENNINLKSEKIRVLNHKTKFKKYEGYIYITNGSNQYEWGIFVDYFRRISILSEIIKLNNA